VIIQSWIDQKNLLALQFKLAHPDEKFSRILYNQVKYNVGTSELFRASGKPQSMAHMGYSMLSPRHGQALGPTAEMFAEAKIAVPRGALIPCIFKGRNSDT